MTELGARFPFGLRWYLHVVMWRLRTGLQLYLYSMALWVKEHRGCATQSWSLNGLRHRGEVLGWFVFGSDHGIALPTPRRRPASYPV